MTSQLAQQQLEKTIKEIKDTRDQIKIAKQSNNKADLKALEKKLKDLRKKRKQLYQKIYMKEYYLHNSQVVIRAVTKYKKTEKGKRSVRKYTQSEKNKQRIAERRKKQ